MTTAHNKAVIRRVFDDVFNRGDLAAAHELCTPTIVLHSPTLPGPAHGRAGLERFVTGLRGGFPDIHIVIDDLIAEGDQVVARWRTTRQTQHGEYLGIPPTGRPVTMTGIDIFRLVDGQVDEVWLEMDALGGVQQMGVVPPLGISKFGRVRFILFSLVRFAFLDARHSIRGRASGAAAAR